MMGVLEEGIGVRRGGGDVGEGFEEVGGAVGMGLEKMEEELKG